MTAAQTEPLQRIRTRHRERQEPETFVDVAIELPWYDKHNIPGSRLRLPRYGTIPAPATIHDYIHVANAIADAADAGIRGWRGQARDWGVQTGAARRVLNPWTKPIGRGRQQIYELINNVIPHGAPDLGRAEKRDEGVVGHANDVAQYQKFILNEARIRGFDFVDGRRLNDLELLTLLQHHGAATNLLDISRSALVALWFATSDIGATDDPGVVIAFDQATIPTLPHERTHQTIQELSDQLARERPNSPVGYWAPHALTPRVMGQQGQFLLPVTGEEPWGTVPIWGTHVWKSTQEEKNLDCGHCRAFFIAITPELKAQVKAAGENGLLGLDETSIYPDLPGFSAAHNAAKNVPISPYEAG